MYLRRTREYRNPQLDLLYLENVGGSVALVDPEFGEVIQESATQDPQTVLAAAKTQAAAEQGKAIELLANVVSDTVGRERANAMTALLGIGELLSVNQRPTKPR